jgi:hypothetical protein
MDRLDVGNGIDSAVHVSDVLVLEATHHMSDRVDFANMRQELISESFTLGRPPHESRSAKFPAWKAWR